MRIALKGLRARCWHAVESYPHALLLGLLLLSAPLVFWLAWWQATRWEQSQVHAAVARADSLLAIRQQQAIGDLELAISHIRDLPQLLATEPRLVQLLEQPGAAARVHAANNYLQDISRYLQVDLAWVMDGRGRTLASNNPDSPQSLMGEVFADRLYFTEAMAGRAGHQFAVGRKTNRPGLYFSSAVRAASGRIVGVVAVKTDLSKVAGHIRKRGIFVADEQGVVILSERKELLFQAVPDAPILRADRDARQKRYRRSDFAPLHLAPADASRYAGITLLGEQKIPVLHRAFAIPDKGLTVHLVEELDQLPTWRAQRMALFWLGSLAALAALWATGATLVFVLRARLYRSGIEAANAELIILNDRLKHQAESDFLTGCMNRRRFDEQLHQEIRRSQRRDYPLCLAVLDLDHFKRINDAHGHATGDAVLQHFARFVQGSIRLSDSFARLGGEEFALLMPDTDGPAAESLIERLRALVAAEPFALEDGVPLVITVSIGVTSLCHGDVPKTFIRRADEALYAAKAAGRDRAVHVPGPAAHYGVA